MIDAYAWTTPNGHKLLIALEELEVPHELHWVDIMKGEQFKPEFLAINPNNKIPAIYDRDTKHAVFESGAVLTYLAEKTGRLLGPDRYTTLEWMFFNAGGVGPMGGQLGYFAKFAKEKIPHAIERYTKEVQRLFGVMDKRLGESAYLAGPEFSIADVMNFSWPRALLGFSLEGIDLAAYPNLARWIEAIGARPAVQRALARTPA
ncbi:MAG: glutathione S-transferase N-terminal domain-containing protein [Deltaproteobacteria bacterium]|nr:glutathione S-transferase N-terminal domain-containing protein [Deltaproteobacteria bacterium]